MARRYAGRCTDSGPALIVAWVESGSLMIWREGDAFPRRIASGAVIRPYLAPDGESVAYVRGPAGDPRSLWIADAAGTSERQLADVAALGRGGASGKSCGRRIRGRALPHHAAWGGARPRAQRMTCGASIRRWER